MEKRKVLLQIIYSTVGVLVGFGTANYLQADKLKIARCTLSELGSVVYMETSGYVSPNYDEFQQAAHRFYTCTENSFENEFDTQTMLEPVDFR